MITLHGIARSRASRTIWALEELGLDWKLDRVIQAPRLVREGIDPLAPDAPKNTRSPEFLAMSPEGAIPTISDGDFVLTESLAINLYLAEKNGGPMGPSDAHERALMTQWALYVATWIEEDALTIDRNSEAAAPDAAEVEKAKAALARPFDVLEGHLSGQSNMVGERFTVADINTAEVLRYAQPAADLFDARPALKAWLARAQSRPAFRKMMQMRADDV